MLPRKWYGLSDGHVSFFSVYFSIAYHCYLMVMSCDCHMQESLKQLDILAKSWPKEPNIYISKGKV